MPQLTRRRSDNAHQETWHIHYDDVRVGHVAQRAGAPVDVDQWEWSCGFFPGLHPRQHRDGTAPTFEEALAGFKDDWTSLLPEVTEGALEECRRNRAFHDWKYRMREAGCKMPTQMPELL